MNAAISASTFCLASYVGDVPAIRNNQAPGRPSRLRGDRLHLGGSPVGVVPALDGQDRRAYARQVLFQVPVAEFRGEPGIRPSPKGALSIPAVVPRQLFLEPPFFVGPHRLPDPGNCDVLDKDMGGFGYDSCRHLGMDGREEQRNRTPVTVAHQEGLPYHRTFAGLPAGC